MMNALLKAALLLILMPFAMVGLAVLLVLFGVIE